MPMLLQLAAAEENKRDLKTLVTVVKNSREWLEEMIEKKSDVLVQGFQVNNIEEFNEIIKTFGWEDIHYV
ncbi:hypothetical protein K1719_003297 [Acacia pycnantha]|nr:hypothetical protein K1719_003297 [Acacia pycnantha]